MILIGRRDDFLFVGFEFLRGRGPHDGADVRGEQQGRDGAGQGHALDERPDAVGHDVRVVGDGDEVGDHPEGDGGGRVAEGEDVDEAPEPAERIDLALTFERLLNSLLLLIRR